MSIHAFVGMPGSGKTYDAVANQILPALREGRTVVTNIPMHMTALRKVVSTGRVVEFPLVAVAQNPDTIKDYVVPGCLFVLDEVWRLFPAGDKVSKIPDAYKSLFAEHRHMLDSAGRATQIVLVTQDLALVAAFSRRLVENTYFHTKLGHMGMEGRFRVDILHGPVEGTIAPTGNRLREVFGEYSEEIWSLYDSHTMSQSVVGEVHERPLDRRANVLKRPFFIIGVPLALAAAGFGVYHLLGEAHKYGLGGAPARPSSAAPAAPSGPRNGDRGPVSRDAGPARSVAPVAPAGVGGMRLVGYVRTLDRPGDSFAVLSTGGVHVIEVPLSSCQEPQGELLRCELEGVYYSQLGAALDAGGVALQRAVSAFGGQGQLPSGSYDSSRR